MAVTIQQILTTAESVTLIYSSDLPEPTFYIYRDGILIEVTTATAVTYSLDPQESPVWQILDDLSAVPAPGFPAREELCWLPSIETAYYRVEQYVSGSWSEIGRIAETGLPFYAFTTAPLEDSTTYYFRVVPVGINGNNGAAQYYSFEMVRHPDPPDATYAYDSETRKITVEVA